ncbi:hypothetical protein UB51_21370 [Paenibacillus sp. IHBB 10380]|nr:hypothetical protein UB51_21370 [Paenibacillus sp. IHBB 10380]
MIEKYDNLTAMTRELILCLMKVIIYRILITALIHNQCLKKIETYADRSGEDGIVVEKRSVRLCP